MNNVYDELNKLHDNIEQLEKFAEHQTDFIRKSSVLFEGLAEVINKTKIENVEMKEKVEQLEKEVEKLKKDKKSLLKLNIDMAKEIEKVRKERRELFKLRFETKKREDRKFILLDEV